MGERMDEGGRGEREGDGGGRGWERRRLKEGKARGLGGRVGEARDG